MTALGPARCHRSLVHSTVIDIEVAGVMREHRDRAMFGNQRLNGSYDI